MSRNSIMKIVTNIYFYLIILFVLLIAISIESYFLLKPKKEVSPSLNNNVSLVDNSKSIIENAPIEDKKVHIDIKGAVKKPGVYEVLDKSIINDCIKLAGGLKSNAYTKNINLSKKVSDELVIYVYSKTEYAKIKNPQNDEVCNSENYSIDKCIEQGSSVIVESENKPNSSNDKPISGIVNINTASIEELTTLDGVGQSKAEKIIEYRNNNGLFKSIDDLLNVSGIGESVFEKIKANITV